MKPIPVYSLVSLCAPYPFNNEPESDDVSISTLGGYGVSIHEASEELDDDDNYYYDWCTRYNYLIPKMHIL